MKSLFLASVLGCAAFAQSPLPQIADSQVVAKIDGKDVTAGEVQAALLAMPPEFVTMYNRNPAYAVQQIYMMRYLSGEAEKLGLGDRPPYKEQLEMQRANVLAGALLSFQQDHFPVSDEAVKKYFDDHRDVFQQAKVKAIMIRYKPSLPATAPVEQRMAADTEARAYGVTRTEDEARTRAAEVAKKLKDGGNFADLVIEYSDDLASKKKEGDYGAVAVDSSHPDEIKKAVQKLKAGDTSDPIRASNAYFVLRVVEKSAQTVDQVQGLISADLRKSQMNAWFTDVTRRFQPAIVNKEFFTMPANIPGAPAPVAMPQGR
jgi:peptidyl-prolyl cis-trans isomerase C